MRFAAFILLVIILLSQSALSKSLAERKDNILVNEEIASFGKSIKVLSASADGSLKVSVDGVESTVSINSNVPSMINGAGIRILGYKYYNESYSIISLEIKAEQACEGEECNNEISIPAGENYVLSLIVSILCVIAAIAGISWVFRRNPL